MTKTLIKMKPEHMFLFKIKIMVYQWYQNNTHSNIIFAKKNAKKTGQDD